MALTFSLTKDSESDAPALFIMHAHIMPNIAPIFASAVHTFVMNAYVTTYRIYSVLQLEQEEREAAERERKLKAKQGKKEKARGEKERLIAEKAAKEAAEAERLAEEERVRREAAEEERRRRLEEVERLRREEEDSMERRRQELLSDENGYWRRRMEAEAKAVEVAVVAVGVADEDVRAVEEVGMGPCLVFTTLYRYISLKCLD